MSRRRPGPAAAAVLVALVVAAACGSTQGPIRGGEAWLPGPPPGNVTIASPDPSAPPAPPFTLTLLDNARLDVSTLWADRPVIVFFLASWCGPCVEQQAMLADLQARYGDALGIVGIALQDSPSDLARFLEDHDVRYPVGIDEDFRIANRYAADAPPLVALVGPGGGLLRGWPGGVTPEALQAILDELLTTS